MVTKYVNVVGLMAIIIIVKIRPHIFIRLIMKRKIAVIEISEILYRWNLGISKRQIPQKLAEILATKNKQEGAILYGITIYAHKAWLATGKENSYRSTAPIFMVLV